MKDIGEDVAVYHPLIRVDQCLQRSPGVRISLELGTSGFDLEREQIIGAEVMLASDAAHARKNNLLVFPVVAIVDDAGMLSE